MVTQLHREGKIMLGLYEWLHEEIAAENAAKREGTESNG